MRAGAKPASPLALTPANFAALSAPGTARAGVPSGVHAPAPGYGPADGAVHVLGHGKAFAWVREGAVCWSSGIASGCADSSRSNEHALDAVISDADEVRQGEPARIAGLAVDGVVRVAATMKDGSTLAAVPVDNWYEIDLPGTAAPWDVARVSATLRSGRTTSLEVTLSAPAVS